MEPPPPRRPQQLLQAAVEGNDDGETGDAVLCDISEDRGRNDRSGGSGGGRFSFENGGALTMAFGPSKTYGRVATGGDGGASGDRKADSTDVGTAWSRTHGSFCFNVKVVRGAFTATGDLPPGSVRQRSANSEPAAIMETMAASAAADTVASTPLAGLRSRTPAVASSRAAPGNWDCGQLIQGCGDGGRGGGGTFNPPGDGESGGSGCCVFGVVNPSGDGGGCRDNNARICDALGGGAGGALGSLDNCKVNDNGCDGCRIICGATGDGSCQGGGLLPLTGTAGPPPLPWISPPP